MGGGKKENRLLSRDVALILAASFFHMACSMLVTPLITGFSASIGAGAVLMGIIGGGMNLCSLFCRPLIGNLTDKNSKYRLALIGACILIFSSAGYVLVTNKVILLLLRIINGFGFACCTVCMSTWMAQLLPPERTGEGMGLYGTMNALAMAASPAIGVALRNRFGYRMAFCMAVVFGIGALVCIVLVKDKGLPEAKDPSLNRFQIIDKHVLPITVTVMCFGIPYCATQNFLVNYIEAGNLDLPTGLFFPVYAGFLLILRFSLKKLFDKVPFIGFFAVGNASALLAMICLYRLEHVGLLVLAALFMAGGYGIMCTVCQSTAILIAGEGRKGLANSTYYVGLDLGMTLGPFLGGIVFGRFPVHQFYLCFMVMVPLCIVLYAVTAGIFKKR